MGAWIDIIGVRSLSGAGEDEAYGMGCNALTHAFTFKGLSNCGEKTENLHGVLSREGLEGGVKEVDLSFQLLEQKVGIWVDVRHTVRDAITAIIYHKTARLNVRHQREKSRHRTIIRTIKGRRSGGKGSNGRGRRIAAGIIIGCD